jgi:hypothetical protein
MKQGLVIQALLCCLLSRAIDEPELFTEAFSPDA